MEYIFTNPIITGIVMGCLTPMVIVSAIFWAWAKMNRDDNELKRSMLERGMSVEDIERVMNAGSCAKRAQKTQRPTAGGRPQPHVS